VRGETCASAEETVRGADILVTATNSGEPVVEAGWVGAGAHINAMGSNQARRRELPGELVRKVDVVVADSIEQSRMEAGDLLLGFSEEDWTRVVELRDVAAGRAGRTRPDQLTMFKSNGLAVEDVAAAGWVYEHAREAGAGRGIYS
jgi:alanine dehydrogenase